MWYLSFSFWLTSLSMIISSCIHVAASGIISFFFMAEWYSIVCMYHLCQLFICQWIFRLGPCLAIVNSATMNIGVHVSFLEFCLDACPGVGLLDHMLILFLVFWGISVLFSIVAAAAYILTSRVGGRTWFKIKLWMSESEPTVYKISAWQGSKNRKR